MNARRTRLNGRGLAAVMVPLLALGCAQIEANGLRPSVQATPDTATEDRTMVDAAPASQARLELLLGTLERALPVPTSAQLDHAQQAWRAFVHQDCIFRHGLFAGGSVAALIYRSCVAAHTEARIDDLKLLLCEGYGMTGSCTEAERYANPAQE